MSNPKEQLSFPLGKNGLTDSVIESLSKTFKNHNLVKINILKNCTRDKKQVKEIAATITTKLKEITDKDYTSKIIGFSIFIRKWRKLKPKK